MMTEKDIQADLEQISHILNDCRHLTLDSYNMFITDSSVKFVTIHRNKFLERVRKSFSKLAVIELTKLYGNNRDNDHFSILLLIKDLKRYHSTSLWKDKITIEELKKIDNLFKSPKIKNNIKNLIELRNEHYAHTDKAPNNNIYDISFFMSDCTYLIEEAENAINFLAEKIGFEIITAKYNGEEMNAFLDQFIEARESSAIQKIKSRNL